MSDREWNAMKPTTSKVDRKTVNTEADLIALDYIYYRLRKANFTWERCPALSDPQRPCLVMRELGDEFERRYSEIYGDLSNSLNTTRFTTYTDFLRVCKELFRGEDYYKVDDEPQIKWSRIVALYVFGGVVAVECVKKGLEEILPDIADWIYIYVRNHLSYWICKQGGWDGLCEFYETRMINEKWDSFKTTIAGVGVVCGAVALAVTLASRW